jgi:ArsR family transcriptional regulator
MTAPDLPIETFAAKAGHAARLLRALANEARLMVLCHLTEGEQTAGALHLRSGLSQSALSQHLAKLRAEGLVATRRESQTVHYRLADPRAQRVLETLAAIFCKPEPRRRGTRNG